MYKHNCQGNRILLAILHKANLLNSAYWKHVCTCSYLFYSSNVCCCNPPNVHILPLHVRLTPIMKGLSLLSQFLFIIGEEFSHSPQINWVLGFSARDLSPTHC